MRTFYEPVDLRSRKEMTEYLKNHFRYYTMNSWNLADSYACNLKIPRLGLNSEVENKLYELLEIQDFFDALAVPMQAFARAHNYRWQVGMNGRSGGYLVLYEGELKPSGHRSYCTECGQQNVKSVEESGKTCGRCGRPARIDFRTPPMQVVTCPGRGVDMGEDFEDWSLSALRERVRLVQEFDRLADEIVRTAIQIANNYEIMEVEISIPQTQKVMVANY